MANTMELVDLRQVQTRELERLFEEEAKDWRDELSWDYRPSLDLIRRFVDSHSLGGYVAIEHRQPAGYGFYVLEDHKGLIGGLFASHRSPQAEVTRNLLSEMLATLRATPRVNRVEAQLMPFGAALDSNFLSQQFRLYAREFMLLDLKSAALKNIPLSAGLRLERWSDRNFEACARLIQLAYANHVDSEINDQYRSESGGMKFLRNIVILPGCGQFLPEASFVVRPVERRSSGGNGAHVHGRRGRGAYDANLRQAGLSRLGTGPAVDGGFDSSAARAPFSRACRLPLRRRMQRRWNFTSDWDSERSKRLRRACGRREARYLRARSFSKPFSSSMNSFTSLKSR